MVNRENDLLFVVTDRNVMNLLAIGKGMFFEIVGITSDDKKILKSQY